MDVLLLFSDLDEVGNAVADPLRDAGGLGRAFESRSKFVGDAKGEGDLDRERGRRWDRPVDRDVEAKTVEEEFP